MARKRSKVASEGLLRRTHALAQDRANRLGQVYYVIETYDGWYEAMTAAEIRKQLSWEGLTRKDAVGRYTPDKYRR